MQYVLDFDTRTPNPKRRKALQACESCRKSKKGCVLSSTSWSCQRCEQDYRPCSFAKDAQLSPASVESVGNHGSINDSRIRNSLCSPPTTDGASASEHVAGPGVLASSVSSSHQVDDVSSVEPLNARKDAVPTYIATLDRDSTDIRPSAASQRELRYATMLDIIRGKDQGIDYQSKTRYGAMKLINGTNPLSALLRQDLKHKIVTNSCSFRTPDPSTGSKPRLQRRGTGVHGYDWKEFYRGCGVSEARMSYLSAVGCFDLPSPSECSHLLEIYFTHVHPMLPVIDRKEFLAAYYGVGSPPSLLVLSAVFLAASRYNVNSSDETSEAIRPHCDDLHTKLRALLEAGISTERIAVIQATIIASLHWEGREGVNSAIDNLSLAVRTCQEMGLHRKVLVDQAQAATSTVILRRIWWVVYALDRFNAAQEGTPFLINEIECDVDPLAEADFADEDSLTCQVTLLNIALAIVIEDAVRKLYAPGEDHTTLFTPRGVLLRQQMSLRLEHLAQRMVHDLLPERNMGSMLQHIDQDPVAPWFSILLTHLDAVRILVHRPFLLYVDVKEPRVYESRDTCRAYATEMVARLQELKAQNTLRFSWPFTVYAIVNCLLIFWYDISAPSTSDRTFLSQSRQSYASVVELLRQLGRTWWAAAAKYHLATALAVAADELQARGRRNPRARTLQDDAAGRGTEDTLVQPEFAEEAMLPAWPIDASLSYGDNDFWASIGLDFDSDVAAGVFSIFPDGGC